MIEILGVNDMGWIDYASRIGVVGLLLISHYGFHKRWWVWGREYDDLDKRHELLRQRCGRLEDEMNAWKEQALTGSRIAAGATSIAEAAISRGERLPRQRGT